MSTKLNTAAIVNEGQARKLNILGHDFSVFLGSAATEGNAYIFEVVTPPGMFVPLHRQPHEDEYGYVIEGELEVYLDGQMFPAHSGSVIYLPRGTTHGMLNTGTTPCKVIWLSTPAAKVEASFNELAALPAGGPPDMGKLVALFAKYDMELFAPPASWL